MPENTKPPAYDTKPAEELLTRIRHELTPDKERIKAAGWALLDALVNLQAPSPPIVIAHTSPSSMGNRQVSVSIPQRRATVIVSYVSEDREFVLWAGGHRMPVPLVYDPVHGAFIPKAAKREQPEQEPTALELLLKAVWNAFCTE